MNPRERGVAHVNIFWSLVPMVLMLGAAGYGYMKHVEADEAVTARAEATAVAKKAKAVLEHREAQLKELTAKLGNADKYKEPVVAIEDYTSPSSYTTPESLQRVFDTLKGKLGLPSSLDTLDSVVNMAGVELQARQTEVANLTKQLGEARTALATAQGATDSVRSDLTGQISTAQATIAAERTKLDNQVRTGTEQIEEANKKTREAIAQKEAISAASNQAIAKLADEKMQLNASLENALGKVRLINSPSEPDGRIISSSTSTDLAWINIGGRDMVKAGMNFRILGRVKSKSGYQLKGHGVVTLVERDRAQIRVTDLVNPLNYVVAGDSIANDLYSKKLKRNIYLIGRFVTPLSKPEITRILEDMGNKVVSKMSPQVDLVIVGREPVGEDVTPIAEMPEFINASKWNAEIATLNKIRDFLKL